MWLEQEAVAIHRLLSFGPVDILDLCRGRSPSVLEVGLLPHVLPSPRCHMQGEPLRLTSEEPVNEAHKRVAGVVVAEFKSLSGAPILGSHLLVPFLDGLFAVEMVSIVHLGTPVVLGRNDSAWIPAWWDHLGDVGFLPLGRLNLLLLDQQRHGVLFDMLEVSSYYFYGDLLLHARSSLPAASLFIPLLRSVHLPHFVLAHVWSLGRPSMLVGVVGSHPLPELITMHWWHFHIFFLL